MRSLLFLAFTVFLFSCASNLEQERMVNVSYPESDGVQLLSSDLFSDVEVVRLTGEQLPPLGYFSELIVTEDNYFISSGAKVLRFNREGAGSFAHL